MQGSWRQGGKEPLVLFESCYNERRFLINYIGGSVRVQGCDAMTIDVQIRAARSALGAQGA